MAKKLRSDEALKKATDQVFVKKPKRTGNYRRPSAEIIQRNLSKNFFPKGTSGNPGGRPKKLPITDRIADLLETRLPDDLCAKLNLKQGATYADGLVLRKAMEALSGDNGSAFNELCNRVEGTPRQRIEIAAPPEDTEVRFKVVYEKTVRVVEKKETSD